MRRLNVIHASVFGLGVFFAATLVAPATLLKALGVPDLSFATLGVVRMAGVLALALAAVLWSARRWLYSPEGASTLWVLAVICAMIALMLVAQQVAVWSGLTDVVPVVFLTLLAAAYGLAAQRLAQRRVTA